MDCAWLRFSTCCSAMEAGLGVPDAVLTELQKKNFAGEGRWERRHRLRRLWVPRMCCCSNERTPRLKFTAQALWMMVVVDERRWSRFGVLRPRSGLLRSLGSAYTLASSVSVSWMLRLASDCMSLAPAAAWPGARTSAQTSATSGFLTSSSTMNAPKLPVAPVTMTTSLVGCVAIVGK